MKKIIMENLTDYQKKMLGLSTATVALVLVGLILLLLSALANNLHYQNLRKQHLDIKTQQYESFGEGRDIENFELAKEIDLMNKRVDDMVYYRDSLMHE